MLVLELFQVKYVFLGLVIVPVCLFQVSQSIKTIQFSDSYPRTSIEFIREYGGSEDRFQQILTSDYCAWLSEGYDRASDIFQNYQTEFSLKKRAAGIMKAASKRMEEIDCNDR